MISEADLRKISEDIRSSSTRLAQEVYLQRRSAILQEVETLTGIDYGRQIPTIKKGRPNKNVQKKK